jgi:hypothetical protein
MEVLIALANGQRRAVSLVNTDIDTFMAGAVQLKARESLAVIQCMDPQLDEVVATLPTLPLKPAPAPPPALAYVPPSLPPVAPPPQPVTNPPVTVVIATVNAAPAPAAAQTSGRLATSLEKCRSVDGGHIQCDVRVSNRTGRDAKLMVFGAQTKALGEEGSQTLLDAIKMGERMVYTNGGEREATVDLIADASPVVQFHFWYVPKGLLSLKRVEITLAARLGADAEKQTFTFANLPIEGR